MGRGSTSLIFSNPLTTTIPGNLWYDSTRTILNFLYRKRQSKLHSNILHTKSDERVIERQSQPSEAPGGDAIVTPSLGLKRASEQ
jgi:hypothetical protein